MPARGEQCDRDRADSARRSRDEHVAGIRGHVVVGEQQRAERRGEAGGADRRGVLRGERVGDAHERVARHPRPFGEAAVMTLADARAVQHDAIAGRPCRV